MSEMTPKERRERVRLLRESGLTYKAIGQQMGFGVERARQLYMKAIRKQLVFDYPLYKNVYLGNSMESREIRMHVSSRTINTLCSIGVKTVVDLIDMNVEEVKKIPYVGRKTIAEIKWFQEKVKP